MEKKAVKPGANSKAEMKKYDVTFNVVMNWRFMKEIYTWLLKMPKDLVELTMQSIAFCIANDLK